MPRIDVSAAAAPDVHTGAVAPDDLAGSRVIARRAGRAERGGLILIFVNSENLQPRALGIEIAHMQRIAMTQAGAEKPLAVVIDDHRVIDDLVLPIPINISHADAVRAHA